MCLNIYVFIVLLLVHEALYDTGIHGDIDHHVMTIEEQGCVAITLFKILHKNLPHAMKASSHAGCHLDCTPMRWIPVVNALI